MIKTCIDTKAKEKATKWIFKEMAKKGIPEDVITPRIAGRLDDLMQAVIDDIGYIKLAKMGFK